MDHDNPSPKESSTNDTASLGATIADKMLTMLWTASAGWDTAVIRPFGPLPLFPTANVLHYGLSVFEALKAHKTTDGGVALFRPDDHVTRLNQSARRLTLPEVPVNFTDILATYVNHVRSWVPQEEGSSLYLRIVLFGSEARLGVKPSSSAILVIMGSPLQGISKSPSFSSSFQKGMRLRAYPHFSRAAPGGVGACKTGGNYAAAMYPTQLAKEQGYDHVLWLSDASKRLITEAGVMNVFFVLDRNHSGKLSLVTPRKDGTILDGITRRSILSLAIDMGMDVQERDVPMDEIFRAAQEGSLLQMFGTGTASIIRPISSVECDGQIIQLHSVESETDLSVMFRQKLLRIFQDAKHPWTMSVPTHDRELKVLTSLKPVPADDVHSWW